MNRNGFRVGRWCKVAALCLMLLGTVTARADHHEGDNSCRTLVVTGNPEYPPWLWSVNGPGGELEGAAAQLLREALDGSPWTPEFRAVETWARAQAETRLGRADMIAGAFITAERQTWMDYIQPPMADMPNVIFTRKDGVFPFDKWSDLIPYRGATLLNNSFGQEFDTFARQNLRIEEVGSIEQAFRMLARKRVDYVVFERYQGMILLNVLRLTDVIVPLRHPVNAEGLYFTVSKASPCNTEALKAHLARRVAELVGQGRPEALAEHYTRMWADRQPPRKAH